MAPTDHRPAAPTVGELAAWIDTVADQFEQAWKRAVQPRIACYLGNATGASRLALLTELVMIDFAYRAQTGGRPRLDDYLRDFPELRQENGLPPDNLVRYASRLGERCREKPFAELRCPECGERVEAARGPSGEVTCPGCGTGLRLTQAIPQALREAELPTLLGRFQLLELLGTGSFGAVYKARDVTLDRFVALKVPRAGYFSTPEDQERFQREARSAAQLRHPHIVPVLEIGREGELPFLVSDLVEGRTLASLLAAQRLPLRRVAEMVADIADALAYAHAQKVVHRDVNPRNILIDSAGRPLVTDFGLARRSEGEVVITTEGQILGTPAYLSPEQALGELDRVDPRSDVYSLGVILYEMLTGELPFRGQVHMLLQQIVREEPRPLRRINDRIPRDLETICLKAMAKSPARRYTTAEALASDLRRYLNGEAIHARPVGSFERCGRWCRRNPLLSAALAGAAVSLLAGASIASYFAARAAAQHRETQLEHQQGIVYQQNAREMDRLRGLAEQERAEVNRQRSLVRRYLYFSRIDLAHRAWREGHVARMEELLREEPSANPLDDCRGFEWYYLWRLRHANQLTLHCYSSVVPGLAFSPEGTLLACSAGGPDPRQASVLDFWSMDSRRLNRRLQVPGPGRLVFLPDGKQLARGMGDRYVELWDPAAGRILWSAGLRSGLRFDIPVAANEQSLASAGDRHTVSVRDVVSGRVQHTLTGHHAPVSDVAFSPSGKRLASASQDHTVKLWELASGRELFTAVGHTGQVNRVQFSPDGALLASGAQDWTARTWDAATGRPLRTLPHPGNVAALSFHPNGRRLVTASRRLLYVWEANSGRLLFTLKGHSDEVTELAFSPDGNCLASSARDGTVKLWQPSPQEEARVIPWHNELVRCVVFSPDGTRLAGGAGDRTVRLWDPATGRELAVFQGHTDQVRSLAFSPEGRRLASASNDRTIKIWDADVGQVLLTLRGHGDRVTSVCFSPDGKRLASGSEDHTVKVWDAATGKELLTFRGHQGRTSVAFSPDGERLASASEDETVKIWDSRTGRELHTLRSQSSMTSVAWSPDGRTLASGCRPGTITLWDAATGQELRVLKGHTEYVCSVVFSPDGRRLASGSYDLKVKIWDAVTGQDALTLGGHTRSVQSVAFSPDGRRLASASGDGTLRIWDAAPLAAEP